MTGASDLDLENLMHGEDDNQCQYEGHEEEIQSTLSQVMARLKKAEDRNMRRTKKGSKGTGSVDCSTDG